jgi:hypothetical protein
MSLMNQVTIKTPNAKCRLYWCLIEFIDWRYKHYFSPLNIFMRKGKDPDPQQEFFLLLVPCLCGSGTRDMAHEAALLLRSFFWELCSHDCSPKVNWLVFLIMDLAPKTDQVWYTKPSFPCSVEKLETLKRVMQNVCRGRQDRVPNGQIWAMPDSFRNDPDAGMLMPDDTIDYR